MRTEDTHGEDRGQTDELRQRFSALRCQNEVNAVKTRGLNHRMTQTVVSHMTTRVTEPFEGCVCVV